MTTQGQASNKAEKDWRKDDRFKALLVILFLFSAIVVTAIVGYPLMPVPSVQGYLLKGAEKEFSVNAPIKVTFDQFMDQKSVEGAFKIEPALEGKFEWQGNTLNFLPARELQVGERFEVSVSREAKSLIQKNLGGEYRENFVVVESPEVAFFTPNNGSTEIGLDSKITMMFDRPMVQFTTIEEAAKQFPEFKIEPAVSGEFKWLGSTAVQFKPDALDPATKYKVTIPAGVTSIDGGSTEKEYISEFETAKPKVELLLSELGESFYSQDNAIKLQFNQKIDLASAKEKIKITHVDAAGAGTEIPYEIRYFNNNDFKKIIEWQEERVEMNSLEELQNELEEIGEDLKISATLDEEIPDQKELEKSLILIPKLESGKKYNIVVGSDLLGVKGNLGSLAEQGFTFETVGEFKVTGQQNPVNEGVDFYDMPILEFSNPVNLRSMGGKIVIEPVSEDKEAKMNLNLTSESSFSIDYPYLPSTKYKVVLKAGGKDIFGNELKEDYQFEFENPALPANLQLETTGDLTVLDGGQTALFYLKSANVFNADLALKKLSQAEFDTLYENGYVDYRRLPNADGSWQKATQKIELKFNENGYSQIDLDKTYGDLTPGFYLLQIDSPEWLNREGSRAMIKQAFVVSDSALAVKLAEKEMMIWATDLAKGEPLSGMQVRAYDQTRKIQLSGVTDENGLLKISLPEVTGNDYYREFTVIGERNSDLAFSHSTWSEGIAPWNFNIESEMFAPKYFGYVYTDRPIYRPGQEVYFKGIIRKTKDGLETGDANIFNLPDVKKVNVMATDGQGNTLLDKDIDLSANGTFDGKLQLGASGSGSFNITAKLVDAKGPEWANSFYQSFKVLEYRKPEYKLDLTADKEEYINGENAEVKVVSGYFFGAPMPDAQLKWTLKSNDYYFILPESLISKLNGTLGGSWFSFSDEGFFCYYGCVSQNQLISQGDIKADAKGEAIIKLPLNLEDKKLSQIYTLEVTVTDANNQSVSNRVSFPVHRGEIYLGVRNDNYVYQVGEKAEIEVLSVDTAGAIKGNVNVEASLFERKWNTVQRKNVDAAYYYENSYEDVLVEKKSVQTAADGLGKVEFEMKKGGAYKVEVSAGDGRGNTVKSSTGLYVTSGDFINWGVENNDRIELVADKMEYKAGETAKILIKSPFTGGKALLTVERDRVLESRIIDISSNSQTIEIPIKENYLPNVFVSVLILKGHDYEAGLIEPPAGEIDQREVAAFKVGYATLQVDTEGKKLNIDIKTDKAGYGPREKVKLTLNTADFNKRAVPAELSVAVVDESVLSLTENVTADLLNVFYRKRYLGVQLAHTLTKALSRVNVQVEAGMKGGGGGNDGQRGIFKDTAYFEGTVMTDASGNGFVEFELPDNLTTWQVLALGISDDRNGAAQSLVGSNKISFTVNKEVLVRPVLPRFLTTGDEMEISAIVHNYSGENRDVEVELVADNLEINSSSKQSVRINAEESKNVVWKIKVKEGEQSVIKMSARVKDSELMDGVDTTLAIKAASFPTNVSTATLIADQNQHIENVWLPKGLNQNQGVLKLSVAATLAGSVNQGLEYLVTFPYGCVEQISSSLLPNLAVKKLADSGKFPAIDAEKLRQNVEGGLQNLYAAQQANGGFGFWSASEPNAYVTAYALQAMVMAEKGGFTVDKAVRESAQKYLLGYINNNSLEQTGENVAYNQTASYKANSRAFILYVLSEIEAGDLGLSNNLYEKKDNLNLAGKIYLAMALQNLAGDDSAVAAKIDQLKKDVENMAIQSPRGVSFEEKMPEYGLLDSNNRTTGLALQMLNRVDVDNPLIPKLIEHLLMEKQGGHFNSTQETAVVLIALTEYLEKTGELNGAFEASVKINGQEVLNQKFSSENILEIVEKEIKLSDLLGDNLDNEISASKSGEGRMYFDLNMEYYLPLEAVKAMDQGLQVSQQYFQVDDKEEKNPLAEAKVGENLRAKMTLIVPQDSHFVMIEDFLPAGLEGVDFNLKTSEQILQDEMEEENYWGMPTCENGLCKQGNWYFSHSEVRDDRMMYFADFLPKGVYEIEYFVRSTSVGEFADLPALAQETYFPEVFGRSEAKEFKVTQ
ncbi:MAG: Ig-like domain-containing protein [Candidatus Altimarinota bacterium]